MRLFVFQSLSLFLSVSQSLSLCLSVSLSLCVSLSLTHTQTHTHTHTQTLTLTHGGRSISILSRETWTQTNMCPLFLLLGDDQMTATKLGTLASAQVPLLGLLTPLC